MVQVEPLDDERGPTHPRAGEVRFHGDRHSSPPFMPPWATARHPNVLQGGPSPGPSSHGAQNGTTGERATEPSALPHVSMGLRHPRGFAALTFGVGFFIVAISMWTLDVKVVLKEYGTIRRKSGIDSPERTPPDCELWKRNRKMDLAFSADLNLNIYPSRDGSKEFILCAYPKTGCSQWIMLLHYLWTGERITTNPHQQGARDAGVLKSDDQRLNSTDIPRILIMRDPYKRTISSYHDFKGRIGNARAQSMSFEDFIVNIVANSSFVSAQGSDHRRPISEGCSNPSWIHGGWDYVFQLEQMAVWLPCFQEMMNFTSIISEGWNNSSLFRTTKLGVRDVYRILVHGDEKSLSKSIVTGHENSDEDLHTPRTIEVVNTIFFNDFVLGGYKLRLD